MKQTVTAPGQYVLVDQLESPIPGFLVQIKGIITNQRYISEKLLVDHFSYISYVHIQRNLTLEDTLNAKQSLGAYSQKQGVVIRHYHTDNRLFSNNAFINQ